jgi:transcriptional regulator with XRE-family HTH domain
MNRDELEAWYTSLGLSQRAFAKRLGISSQHLNMMLQGVREVLRWVPRMQRLAEALAALQAENRRLKKLLEG